MPFITVHTGMKLAPEQKRSLADALAVAITVVPGKTRENLMLAIHDGIFMAFGDIDGRECLHMHVRMYRQAAQKDKERLVAVCTDLFTRSFGLAPECVYITMDEQENWGVGGRFI